MNFKNMPELNWALGFRFFVTAGRAARRYAKSLPAKLTNTPSPIPMMTMDNNIVVRKSITATFSVNQNMTLPSRPSMTLLPPMVTEFP